MKALSLTQPWATLVAIGAKRIETRSWKTSYRGELAIHASQYFPQYSRDLCWTPTFGGALVAAGITSLDQLPLGAVIAVGRLADVGSTDWMRTMRTDLLTPQELEFGNYDSGRYGWTCSDVVALNQPVRAKGALGLWTPEFDLEALIRVELIKPGATA